MPVLLFDTYSLFFRAFHALPPLNTAAGQPSNALYGLVALLIKLLREQKPHAAAFALDVPQQTQRAQEFPAYKQARGALPDALLSQLAQLPSVLDAFGFPAWEAPGFEADDVLATLARKLGARGEDVLVVSGDRDLLQVVRARTHVLFVGQRGGPPAHYDAGAVHARFGLEPEQLPSLTALVGDTSDNLPKVPGIGPKIASQLIAAHGSASALLHALPQVKSPRIRNLLQQHREQILQTERLATLHDDLPLACDTACAAPFTPEALARVHALCEELELASLLPRLAALQPLTSPRVARDAASAPAR
jgi:DNA polymerase-1